MGLSKLFKKKDKYTSGEPEMVYSMTPRHGHGQDVLDENGIRQVAGCLPIDPINKRFLLISSSSNPGTWVIPKGGWEKDETQKQAAMRETWEEAGVKGVITRHIGVFAEKSKSGVKAHHWVYEMEIKEVTKKFPEVKKRQRRWFTYDEAMLAVKAHYIHDALSMSSLSPLIHPVAESVEGGKKKKKNKKKEKKSDEEGDNTDNDNGEKKKKKKKKKEKKSENNDDDEEEDEDEEEENNTEDEKKKKKKSADDTASLNDEEEEKKKKDKKKKKAKKEEDEGVEVKELELDENGVPLAQDEEKKKKKKDKKKKEGDLDNESKTEVEELPLDDELFQIPLMYTSTEKKQDISIPPIRDTKPIINMYHESHQNK